MPDAIYNIYKHTSKTSGKSYIGVTNNLKKRWNTHRAKAKNNTYYDFYKAWRKYGENDWETEILYATKDETHCYLQEIHFIAEYDTYKNGYNMTPGGKVPPPMKGENHPLYGKTHSDEAREKISKNHIDVSGSNNPRAKHIWLKTPDDKLYKTFGTLKIFCITYNLSYCTVMRQLRQNIPALYGSFHGWEIWYPTKEEINNNNFFGKIPTENIKKIIAKGVVIKGIPYEDLYGKEKADELNKLRSEKLKGRKVKNPMTGINHPCAKKVHIKSKNFDIMKEAAEYYDVSPSTITDWINKKDDCWYL